MLDFGFFLILEKREILFLLHNIITTQSVCLKDSWFQKNLY